MESVRRRNVGGKHDVSSRETTDCDDLGKKQSVQLWKIFFVTFIGVIVMGAVVLVMLPSQIDAQPMRKHELPVLDGPLTLRLNTSTSIRSMGQSLWLQMEVGKIKLPVLDGPLTPNDLLSKAEHIYVNQVNGPESLVADGDTLYTSMADGRVVQLKDGVVTTIVKFGPDSCTDEESCGRPLGLRLHGNNLYVLDSYTGLYRVNVQQKTSQLLWPTTAPINGVKAQFFNDLDVSADKIYFTHSSSKWQRKDFAMVAMEGEKSGRLIEYDIISNTTKELMRGLVFANGVEQSITSIVHPYNHIPIQFFDVYDCRLIEYDIIANTTKELMRGLVFANGVQLSEDQSYLLVTETVANRIWKYNIKGPKTGQTEIFIDNLPGMPDNIRRSSTGGFWVGINSAQHQDKFSLVHFMSDKPWLRNIASKLGSKVIMSMIPKYGLILELDTSGNIVRSLHDPSGKVVYTASEVEDTGSVLYIGSYNQPYLSKLTL